MIPRRAMETSTGRLVQFAQLAAPGEPEGALVRSIAAQLPAAVGRPPKDVRRHDVADAVGRPRRSAR